MNQSNYPNYTPNTQTPNLYMNNNYQTNLQPQQTTNYNNPPQTNNYPSVYNASTLYNNSTYYTPPINNSAINTQPAAPYTSIQPVSQQQYSSTPTSTYPPTQNTQCYNQPNSIVTYNNTAYTQPVSVYPPTQTNVAAGYTQPPTHYMSTQAVPPPPLPPLQQYAYPPTAVYPPNVFQPPPPPCNYNSTRKIKRIKKKKHGRSSSSDSDSSSSSSSSSSSDSSSSDSDSDKESGKKKEKHNCNFSSSSVKNESFEDLKCSICETNDDIIAVIHLKCNHCVCVGCLEDEFRNNEYTCSKCDRKYDIEMLKPKCSKELYNKLKSKRSQHIFPSTDKKDENNKSDYSSFCYICQQNLTQWKTVENINSCKLKCGHCYCENCLVETLQVEIIASGKFKCKCGEEVELDSIKNDISSDNYVLLKAMVE